MEKTTRRRFLKAAAAGALPLAGAPMALAAGDAPPSPDQALASLVRLRFKHLTEDQLKAVLPGLQRGLFHADVLKQTRLGPLDEPATIFVADLAE